MLITSCLVTDDRDTTLRESLLDDTRHLHVHMLFLNLRGFPRLKTPFGHEELVGSWKDVAFCVSVLINSDIRS